MYKKILKTIPFNILKKEDYSFYLFIAGLFLLPSAFTLAGIFLLISIINSTVLNKTNHINNKWNIFFIIGSILMIASCLMHTFTDNSLLNYNLEKSLSWIGLANWLPLFWCYWGFKPFLNNPYKRKLSSLALFCGTLPVLITGIGQYFFKWYGPFSFMNGFIVWYQRPIDGLSGLTGLFNNPNYMGSWLNIIWPVCLACLIESNKRIIRSLVNFIYSFGISLSILLTNSRSAWISIFIGTLLFFGKKSYKLIFCFIIFIFLLISSTIYPIFGKGIQLFLQDLIPNAILNEFTDIQYSRLSIWEKGLETVYNNPIFGSGAGSFPEIYKYETGLWKGHSHNLILELLISYGIPAGLFVLIPILTITVVSVKNIFLKSKIISIFDKSWITSLVVLLISQMFDIQYFDGRISITLWLLISGSSNILDEIKNSKI